jgi:hypothetical protein
MLLCILAGIGINQMFERSGSVAHGGPRRHALQRCADFGDLDDLSWFSLR